MDAVLLSGVKPFQFSDGEKGSVESSVYF